jgi:putative mRNA 3-end processing factor
LINTNIVAQNSHKKILLDPHRKTNSDFVFVSHAHTDHLHKTKGGCSTSLILTSRETSLIARERGYSLGDIVEEHPGFLLLNSGHILGSKGLVIDDEIYYTGDLSTRSRGFMRPAVLPQIETLIIESTFGRPEYIFPDLADSVHMANMIISDCYDRGIPVVLMGYQLGKAQVLTQLFRHWEPMYVYDSVHRINCLYRDLGVDLNDVSTFQDAEKTGKIRKGLPWILISPLTHGMSKFVQTIKSKYNAITIGFSGWAVNKRYKYMMGLDYALPMSDHCDFSELLTVVKKCQPKKIYTFHGFASEFAKTLNSMGFEAYALKKVTDPKGTCSSQFKDSKLDNFL